jgi:hypothetical protein
METAKSEFQCHRIILSGNQVFFITIPKYESQAKTSERSFFY